MRPAPHHADPAPTLLRYLRDQYTLWQLYPMWADLVRAVPHVVLGTRTSRRRDLSLPETAASTSPTARSRYATPPCP
ncbi:DUF6545 domain-containing protein [Streptomyces cirratus]